MDRGHSLLCFNAFEHNNEHKLRPGIQPANVLDFDYHNSSGHCIRIFAIYVDEQEQQVLLGDI